MNAVGPSNRALVLNLVTAALEGLRSHEQEINALNVFPVPDGDTGTNLVMTMETVCRQLETTQEEELPQLLGAITLGSLMGARGNSGVILSQIIRGVCEELARAGRIDSAAAADSLQNGVRIAYQAIRKPVEGTMLTVIRNAAEAAAASAAAGGDLGQVLEATVSAAGESVKSTPNLLPVLKEAGVVDAGGYGLLILGEAMTGALLGRAQTPQLLVGETGRATGTEEADLRFRYCTEFMLSAERVDVEAAEEFLSSVGGSIMVAASPGLTRIHVHTNTPDAVLDWASGLGSVDQVKINDMAEQVEERREKLAKSARSLGGTGVVAVANGEGIVKIFESLGADGIVDGGQTMNPSAAQLAEGVEASPHESVILLPNNPNIIMAAQQVEQLTEKKVLVVPTRSIPEGFAALLAFEEGDDLAENQSRMEVAASGVKTGEITTAVRSGRAGGVTFREGELIGICAGAICIAGRDLEPTLLKLLKKMVAPEDSSITLVFGAGVDEESMERISRRVSRKYDKLDVDVQQGEQPLYPVIVGVE